MTWHLSDLTDAGLGRALILDPGTAHRIVLSRAGWRVVLDGAEVVL